MQSTHLTLQVTGNLNNFNNLKLSTVWKIILQKVLPFPPWLFNENFLFSPLSRRPHWCLEFLKFWESINYFKITNLLNTEPHTIICRYGEVGGGGGGGSSAFLFWVGKKFLIKVCLIIPPAWHGQMVTRVIKLKPYDGPNSGLMFFFFIRVSHFFVMFAILKLFHG